MKHSLGILWGAAVLLSAASCSSKPDSVEQAQEANNAKAGIANADTTILVKNGREQRPAFDSEFMTKAASGGLLEVQLGQQVAQKATTPEAKSFAQQMVTDHTKSNDELKALAAQKNITLPTTLGEDQQKVYDEVLAEKGAELDKKYVSAMLTDHREDIKEYQEAVTKSTDTNIKTYAQKNLPVLQMHLGLLYKMQPVIVAKK